MNRNLRIGLGLGLIAGTIAIAAPATRANAPLPNWSGVPTVSQDRPAATDTTAADGYRQVIERTQAMVSDPAARRRAAAAGLDILNVTWEDTGRFYGSAVGPNISDMTIQVQRYDPATRRHQLHLMPVIRHPNFEDLSADISLDNFFVMVGNERGEDLQRVPLADVLGNLRRYLHNPDSWAGRGRSLLAPNRDSHVLVSAQACFLPIPQEGSATFNPVLFNYQSYPGDPAVLTLLATREGTSITVIDNQRDGFEAGRTWGQRLFFNQNGERASFTGQRLSDFEAQAEAAGVNLSEAEAAGLNLVMLIQVPLKQREPMHSLMDGLEAAPAAPSAMAPQRLERSGSSDVEAAVIGHGEVEGPFTEIDNLAIERDPDYPIRVTVQFYKATSNGVVSEADIADIRQQIDRVYADADYVGSLVVDGPSDRPTEHDGPHEEPADWWERFWERHRRWLERR